MDKRCRCIFCSKARYARCVLLCSLFLADWSVDQSFPDHVPGITTLRVLFTHYLDFNAVPRRPFFSLLRHFARDNLEREKLDEFLSVEGAVSWNFHSSVLDVMRPTVG